MQDETKNEVAKNAVDATTLDIDFAQEPPPKTGSGAIAQKTPTAHDVELLKRTDNPGSLVEYPHSAALWQLQETGVKPNAMVLLYPMVLNIEKERHELRRQLEQLKELHHAECMKNVRLEEKLESQRALKFSRNACLTIGGLLNTVAIKLFEKERDFGFFLFALGIAALLVGWSIGPSKQKK